jgi:hypothetical protein
MRRFVVVLVGLLVLFAVLSRGPEPARAVPGAVVFPLKLAGESWQPQVVGVPGKKLGNGKVKDAAVTAVLQGVLPDFAADHLDRDPSGKFFLHYDGRSTWRVATNANGDDASTLQGQVSNDGVAWMFGTYALPMNLGEIGNVFVTAKVKFVKGTFTPASVKGTFFFSSKAINTGLILKFKTEKPVV